MNKYYRKKKALFTGNDGNAQVRQDVGKNVQKTQKKAGLAMTDNKCKKNVVTLQAEFGEEKNITNKTPFI